MLASHLHLPTAAWGGHMGHFLLSVLILSSSTPLGNMASTSAELNSKFLVQDRPHKSFQDRQVPFREALKNVQYYFLQLYMYYKHRERSGDGA